MLTPEQIENWRNVLFNIIGPYAMLMSTEEIQAYVTKFQSTFEIPCQPSLTPRA